MRDRIAVGALILGASSTAHADTFSTVTCDPDVIADIQSILAAEGASLADPTLECLAIDVDLDRAYNGAEIPDGLVCQADGDPSVGEPLLYLFTDAVTDPRIREMIDDAGRIAPKGGSLRLSLSAAIVYDEEDFPVCGRPSGS